MVGFRRITGHSKTDSDALLHVAQSRGLSPCAVLVHGVLNHRRTHFICCPIDSGSRRERFYCLPVCRVRNGNRSQQQDCQQEMSDPAEPKGIGLGLQDILSLPETRLRFEAGRPTRS